MRRRRRCWRSRWRTSGASEARQALSNSEIRLLLLDAARCVAGFLLMDFYYWLFSTRGGTRRRLDMACVLTIYWLLLRCSLLLCASTALTLKAYIRIHTHTHIHTQTHTHTHTHTHRNRHRHRQTDWHTHTHTSFLKACSDEDAMCACEYEVCELKSRGGSVWVCGCILGVARRVEMPVQLVVFNEFSGACCTSGLQDLHFSDPSSEIRPWEAGAFTVG
jgi:hypothetical protein